MPKTPIADRFKLLMGASHAQVVRLLAKYQPEVYTGKEDQLPRVQAVYEALCIEYGPPVVIKEWGRLAGVR